MQQKQEEYRQLKSFGLITGLATAAVFGLLLPWLFDHGYPKWPWIVTIILWFFALVRPQALGPLSKIWLKIGHWLGWFNTRVILGLMYYTVFFVTGVIMRLMGKDPMARKLNSSIESYRVQSKVRPKNHVERPF
jgi:hypothetical protein